MFFLRKDLTIKSALLQNETIIVYNAKDWKLVLNTLYDVQKAFSKIVEVF